MTTRIVSTLYTGSYGTPPVRYWISSDVGVYTVQSIAIDTSTSAVTSKSKIRLTFLFTVYEMSDEYTRIFENAFFKSSRKHVICFLLVFLELSHQSNVIPSSRPSS